MSNQRIMQAAAKRRHAMRPEAKRLYKQHRDQIPALIHQLMSLTQAKYDRAYELLNKMGQMIVPQLIDALNDPELDEFALSDVVAILGLTADERVREPLWEFFQAHQDDLDLASTTALSLSGLGDERVLSFMRRMFDSDDEELVANAVASMISLGTMEDIPRLRNLHRQHVANDEIRLGIASAVLTIVGETDERTFNRTLDGIHGSFADRYLWDDIWAILEEQFGGQDVPWQ